MEDPTSEPTIVWAKHQRDHIERRHGVSLAQFRDAWASRNSQDDRFNGDHPEYGPCFLSWGFDRDDELLELVWRFQTSDSARVWPITAYRPVEARGYTPKQVQRTRRQLRRPGQESREKGRDRRGRREHDDQEED